MLQMLPRSFAQKTPTSSINHDDHHHLGCDLRETTVVGLWRDLVSLGEALDSNVTVCIRWTELIMVYGPTATPEGERWMAI